MSFQPIDTSAGYFGKAPAFGDFIKHNLTRAFIEPWDDWLRTALAHSREQMGENWLDTYLTSPIYRFILTPGICGESSWRGVIMPSVDRVGRNFPMTICAPADPIENPFQLLSTNEEWFNQAEQLILSTLEDSLTIGDFNQSLLTLDNIKPPNTPALSVATIGQRVRSEMLAVREPIQADNSLQSLFPELLNSILVETSYAYSIWATQGSETVSASVLIAQGLPPTGSVGAMIDGDWARWGWLDNKPELDVATQLMPEDKDPWDE